MCYNQGMVYIDPVEAAKRLGVSRQWINVLLKDGRLPGARKVGRAWMIPEEALENILPPKKKS
jgi:excisionase family DNA binding protein